MRLPRVRLVLYVEDTANRPCRRKDVRPVIPPEEALGNELKDSVSAFGVKRGILKVERPGSG